MFTIYLFPIYDLQELIVFIYILLFVKQLRGQNQTNGSTGEVLKRTPYACPYIESLIGMVKMKGFLPAPSVVEHHVEGATDSNDNFLASAVGMTTPPFTSRNIIRPIDASDIKRHVLQLFRYRQVTTRINDFRQIKYFSYHDYFFI